MDLTPPAATFDAVRWGVAAGLVALAARRQVAAPALAAGATVALVAADRVPGEVAVMLLLLAAADVGRSLGRLGVETHVELAVVGGLVLAASSERWELLVAAGPVVIGAALTDADGRHRSWRAGPVTAAAAAGGAYATLPDTEEAAVVLGALVATAVLVVADRRVGLGPATSLAGLLVWVAAVGGRGRDGAVVGAVAALGVVVVEPVVHAVARTQHPARTVVAPGLRPVLVLAQVGLALYAGRVAGLESGAGDAVARAALVVVPAGILVAVLTTRAQEPAEQDDAGHGQAGSEGDGHGEGGVEV
jgi:hypothetical protein